MNKFKDRADAGQKLAKLLSAFRHESVIVEALPRGGVSVGAQVAHAIGAPLDLIFVQKIGHPKTPEYAVAVVAEDGDVMMNEDEILALDEHWFHNAVGLKQSDAVKRRQKYIEGRPPMPIRGKTVIIVDDGVATGLSMKCAIREARHGNPKKIIVAVPVVTEEIKRQIEPFADEIIACMIPQSFAGGTAAYYEDFAQVSDAEVIKIMKSMRASDVV